MRAWYSGSLSWSLNSFLSTLCNAELCDPMVSICFSTLTPWLRELSPQISWCVEVVDSHKCGKYVLCCLRDVYDTAKDMYRSKTFRNPSFWQHFEGLLEEKTKACHSPVVTSMVIPSNKLSLESWVLRRLVMSPLWRDSAASWPLRRLWRRSWQVSRMILTNTEPVHSLR